VLDAFLGCCNSLVFIDAIPVSVIVGQIAHGADWDEVLGDFPDLEREDIRQALEYAAWLAQEQVHTA
jgi:uncharacterized protein (DUF433 family)